MVLLQPPNGRRTVTGHRAGPPNVSWPRWLPAPEEPWVSSLTPHETDRGQHKRKVSPRDRPTPQPWGARVSAPGHPETEASHVPHPHICLLMRTALSTGPPVPGVTTQAVANTRCTYLQAPRCLCSSPSRSGSPRAAQAARTPTQGRWGGDSPSSSCSACLEASFL